MNAKLLTLLLVLSTSWAMAANLPFYELSSDNFDEDFNAIDENHLKAFDPQNGGVGVDSVRNYLHNLVNLGGYKDYLPAPTMCVDRKDKDSLYLEVEGEFPTYYFSYFRAQSGAHETTLSNNSNFAALMEHDLYFNLLAIYGTFDHTRSNVYIIIIDKDLFFCDSTRYEMERSSAVLPLNPSKELPAALECTSFPNPTAAYTRLSFELEKAQRVSLALVDPATGSIIARRIEEQYLLEGLHQYDLDLQALPTGRYLLLLQTPHRQQTIPIVKIR